MEKLWCWNDQCCHYDDKTNTCTRVGERGENTGVYGVCWMTPDEGEY